jgi:hypothetical protein
LRLCTATPRSTIFSRGFISTPARSFESKGN